MNIMDGNAEDLDQECADYEAKIKEAGGIHLFVAGGSMGGGLQWRNENELCSICGYDYYYYY